MKLLLVEDEPDLLAGLALALRKQGYAVDTAADGEDGLFKAQSYDYDAIVLDIMLPGLDGWAVLTRLREAKNTPVLILSARDQGVDRVRGLDTGADDYLAKPFDVSELFARLRALIRRSMGQARATFDIGEVHIDTVSRTVTRTGEAITLTAREYQMLEYFALHRGQILSRTTLYEHLFDSNEDTASNILDVYVFNLRKKLGADFISTRRGHGYCVG